MPSKIPSTGFIYTHTHTHIYIYIHTHTYNLFSARVETLENHQRACLIFTKCETMEKIHVSFLWVNQKSGSSFWDSHSSLVL